MVSDLGEALPLVHNLVSLAVTLTCLLALRLLLKASRWSRFTESGITTQFTGTAQPVSQPAGIEAEHAEAMRSATSALITALPPFTPYRVPDCKLSVVPAELQERTQQLRTRLDNEILGWSDPLREVASAHLDLLTLARFIRVSVEVDAAAVHFQQAMAYRVDKRIDALAVELHPSRMLQDVQTLSVRQAAVREHYYAGFGGTMKDGTPFFVERMGGADHTGYASAPHVYDLMVDATLAQYELLYRTTRACSVASSNLVFATCIIDMRGAGLALMRHFDFPKFAATGDRTWAPTPANRCPLLHSTLLFAHSSPDPYHTLLQCGSLGP